MSTDIGPYGPYTPHQAARRLDTLTCLTTVCDTVRLAMDDSAAGAVNMSELRTLVDRWSTEDAALAVTIIVGLLRYDGPAPLTVDDVYLVMTERILGATD
jgi:hypothetical protein